MFRSECHGITADDQMISGRNITPWHGLGEVVGDFDINDLNRIMGWEVQLTPLVTDQGDATNAFATVRVPRVEGEKRIVLGAGLSASYRVLQNTDLIKIVEPFVEHGCALETAGTIKRGQRVWVMLRLSGHIDVKGEDRINQYMLVSNDHTGSQAAKIGLIGVRVVCQNTLNIAERSYHSQLIRILHQGNIVKNMETVAGMLDHAKGQFVNYEHDLELLASRSINATDLRQYVHNCFFDKWSEKKRQESQERITKTESKIIELFETGAGSDLPSARGTVYGAYQAVNHYLNHNREIELETRLSSMAWGSRAVNDKWAFFNALQLAA